MICSVAAFERRGRFVHPMGGDTIPAANREVVVLAEVRSLAIVGSESLGLHLKEIRRYDKLLF